MTLPDLSLAAPLTLGEPTISRSVNADSDIVARWNAIHAELVTNQGFTDVHYAVGLTALPQGEGQVAPALVVALSIPSHVVGQRMQTVWISPDLGVPNEPIRQQSMQAIEAMRSHRSMLLGQGSVQG